MKRNFGSKGMAALCLAVALMALAASGMGLFLRGDGSKASGTSVRGEQIEYAAKGIYKWNAQRIVAEGIGWDIVTFFLAAPAALVASVMVALGSYKGRLFAVGLLAYFAYQFLEYATYWAFNPLFLLYVATFSASLAGIAWMVPSLGAADFGARARPTFPRRGMAAFCLILGAFLALNWLKMIVPALGKEVQGLLLGQTTFVVQAYDLGIIVPLLALTGIATLRRKALGYFLSATLIVNAVAMSSAITAMILSAWFVEGKLELGVFLVFAVATIASILLLVRIYASIDSKGKELTG
ncbi:MAG: hypothetical protein ABSF43_13885 [Rectinemataceae bacterium]|jgi:hypothetical protein